MENVVVGTDTLFKPGVDSSALRFNEALKIDLGELERSLRYRGHLEKKDLAIFGIMYASRRMFPYGKWTCTDGREILFNREYEPIFQKKDGVVTHADRNEWVDTIDFTKTVMFFHDGNPPYHYLVKHLGYLTLDARDTRACKKSLLVCLKILKEWSPKESPSVSSTWSVLKM